MCFRLSSSNNNNNNNNNNKNNNYNIIPTDHHPAAHALMEGTQRGARAECSGTVDNLLIDRIVTFDCYRRRRNLSVAWIDVKKAYDSVDHG